MQQDLHKIGYLFISLRKNGEQNILQILMQQCFSKMVSKMLYLYDRGASNVWDDIFIIHRHNDAASTKRQNSSEPYPVQKSLNNLRLNKIQGNRSSREARRTEISKARSDCIACIITIRWFVLANRILGWRARARARACTGKNVARWNEGRKGTGGRENRVVKRTTRAASFSERVSSVDSCSSSCRSLRCTHTNGCTFLRTTR